MTAKAQTLPTSEAAPVSGMDGVARPSLDLLLPSSSELLLPSLSLGRLIGAHGGGGGRSLREPSGVYIGVDAGWAFMVGAGGVPSTDSAAFGVHLGYRAPMGLAFDARADDLGVSAPYGGGPLLAAGAGLRYWIPLFVIFPYVDAHIGVEDYGPHVTLAGDLGAGVALPLGEHFELDLGARDWIGDIDGVVRHDPVITLGFVVGFLNGRR